MNYLRLLPGYLLGNRDAILRLAAMPRTWLAGLILVLSAGIARNYDHVYLIWTSRWWAGPLIASGISSLFIFAVVRHVLSPTWKSTTADIESEKTVDLRFPQPFWPSFARFFGLYIATAPMAWLYAIPFEDHLPSLAAAKANFCLLGFVSIWRVGLMARVVSVLFGVRFWLALLAVLWPCAMEATVAIVGGGFLSVNVASAMGGLATGPTEVLKRGVQAGALTIAFWGGLVLFGLYCVSRLKPGLIKQVVPGFSPIEPHADRDQASAGWIAPLIILVVICLAIIPVQKPLYRHATIALHQLPQYGWGGNWAYASNGYDPANWDSGEARDLLDHLSEIDPDSLPKRHSLPPDPWSPDVSRLEGILASFSGQEPAWVYIEYLKSTCVFRARGGGTSFARQPESHGNRDNEHELILNPGIANFLDLGAPDGPIGAREDLSGEQRTAIAAMTQFVLEGSTGQANPWVDQNHPDWWIHKNRQFLPLSTAVRLPTAIERNSPQRD